MAPRTQAGSLASCCRTNSDRDVGFAGGRVGQSETLSQPRVVRRQPVGGTDRPREAPSAEPEPAAALPVTPPAALAALAALAATTASAASAATSPVTARAGVTGRFRGAIQAVKTMPSNNRPLVRSRRRMRSRSSGCSVIRVMHPDRCKPRTASPVGRPASVPKYCCGSGLRLSDRAGRGLGGGGSVVAESRPCGGKPTGC